MCSRGTNSAILLDASSKDIVNVFMLVAVSVIYFFYIRGLKRPSGDQPISANQQTIQALTDQFLSIISHIRSSVQSCKQN